MLLIMKKLITLAAICLLGIFCLSSCQNDDDADVVTNIVVEVDSNPCVVYVEWGEPTPMPGMSIMEYGSDEWQQVSQSRIEGFTYEPGYIYRLTVKKTVLANPPADGSSITYTLIQVIEKLKDPSYKETEQ